MMQLSVSRAAAALSIVLLTACGGGGATRAVPAAVPVPLPSSQAAASSAARFTLTIPARSTVPSNATRRSPKYISANTQSAIITLTTVNGNPFSGTTSVTAANLTTSNPACTGSPLTCSISVPAAVGTDVFTISLYDQQQISSAPSTPVGNLLSTAGISVTVAANQNNTPSTPLVLEGVPASITATFSSNAATTEHVSGSVASGITIIGSATYTVTIATQDAQGNTIVGQGAPSITSGSNAISITNTSGSSYAVRVNKWSSAPVTITASTPSGAAPSFTIATVPEVWTTDDQEEIVGYALWPSCSPIACTQLTTDTILALAFPNALAFDGHGNLWAADDGSNSIQEFILGDAGPAVASAATISGFSASRMTFDPSGANLWVPGTNRFVAQNGATPSLTISDARSVYDLAFNPISGNLWINYRSGFASRMVEYDPTTGSATGNSVASDGWWLTFDSSGNAWLGANAEIGEIPAPISGGSQINQINTTPDEVQAGAMDPLGNLWTLTSIRNRITGYNAVSHATAFANITTAHAGQTIAIAP